MFTNTIKPILSIIVLLGAFFPVMAKGQIELYPNQGGPEAESYKGFIGYNSAVRNDPNKPYDKGTCYLFKEWKKADVVVTRDTTYVAKNIYVRIDILNNILEVNYFGQLNLLPFGQVHSVILKDELVSYVTNKALTKDAPRGIYKLLVNADNALLRRLFPKSQSKKTNLDRSGTLAVGISKESGVNIIVDSEFFGLLNHEMVKLEKQRKRFIYNFEDDERAMDYIKANKVNPRNENSLKEFFIFYNSI
jgi:hypothetical protein